MTSSWPGNRRCAPRSTGGRCTSRARSGSSDRNGDELDLRRSFRVDDDREDIGHFLAEAGYLHLEGVFTEAEMAAVSAELDAAMAAATRDDGASWWARTEEGWYPSRILGFNLKSPTLQELLESRPVHAHRHVHRRRDGAAAAARR